jgi:type 1 fimbria pilin
MGAGMSESKDCDLSRRGKKTSKGTCVITIKSTLLRSISRRFNTLEHSLPDVASRSFRRRGEVGRTKKNNAPPLQFSGLSLLLSFVSPSLHFSRFKARHDQ